ncbi:unnamed protein product [Boreogadus saida]
MDSVPFHKGEFNSLQTTLPSSPSFLILLLCHPSTSPGHRLGRQESNHRARRKSIATGKQPSMEIPPTAPPQPFRQSVSTPPSCSRPRTLPASLSLSLPPGDLHLPGPRRHSATPRHPFTSSSPSLSLAMAVASSPSLLFPAPLPRPQQPPPPGGRRGSRKAPSTPPLPRLLPLAPSLAPSLSLPLPRSPATTAPPRSPYSPSSPFCSHWGGDWRVAGSMPMAGPYIAPLPPFEVCGTMEDENIETNCSAALRCRTSGLGAAGLTDWMADGARVTHADH